MTRLFISFALAAFALTAAPPALKAAPLCPLGNATLHGTYVVSGGGTIVGLGPVTSVGEVTYDGLGKSNATFTVSLNGNVQTVTVPGTYTVSPDCTATAVEGPSHYNFVITPNGNNVWWMATDTGGQHQPPASHAEPHEAGSEGDRMLFEGQEWNEAEISDTHHLSKGVISIMAFDPDKSVVSLAY